MCKRFISVNGLRLENVRAGYGAVSVLHDVSLEVREGEFVALLGMNGNGKSTLLNSIVGFVRPSSGSVRLEWNGKADELTRLEPHEVIRRGVGYVPEGRRLVPNLTVEETLRLATGRRRRAAIADALAFAFDTFPILGERRRQLASTLSGGQQQMLAIARALMTGPKIIVIDEPSVGLAPIALQHLLAAIRDLQTKHNLTVLMAEQSFFQAVEVASRAYVLSHGRIIRTLEHGLDREGVETIRAAMMGIKPANA
jgi:branched-chain amino acid transport system ATP-binding protein